MAFTRRFSALPSVAVLLAVSGVVIVNTPPLIPAAPAKFGKIVLVGEFEDGAYNKPTDILSGSDWPNGFGSLGYNYGSQKYQYACAVASGGTEPWNGNAWVQAAKLKFNALCLVRVDTSIGAVNLTPRAFVQGTVKAPFNVAPGQTFIWDRDGVAKTATFAGTAASVTAVAGTYTSFVGGEILPIELDDGSFVDVQFQPGDNTLTAIIARINVVLGATVASNASGELKITSTTFGTGSKVAIGAGTTATTLGLSTTPATGTGDAVNLAVMTFAEFQTKVQGTDSGTAVTTGQTLPNQGYPRIVSKTGGTGTIQIGAGTANAALGFAQQSAAVTAAIPAGGATIPAGTRVSNSGATRVVTTQTTAVAAGSTGTTILRVRPAVDDGSYPGVTANTLVTLEDSPGDLEWTVAQPNAVSAALTAAQLDSAYLTAIAATLGVSNDTTRKINGIVSARTSAAIRGATYSNAIAASTKGHFDRRSFLCLANGSTAAQIIAAVASYRDETATFCAGGVQKFLQEMIDGGYSTTGIVVQHPEIMLASRWSSLPPGYNPGQLPEDPALRWSATDFPALETVAQSWDIDTYAAFKAAGVCAAEIDLDVGLTFEQGVTAVDPAVDPSITSIGRRTLEGYIGDQFSLLAKPQAKRQGTQLRRDNLATQFEGILDQLIPDTIKAYNPIVPTDDGMPVNTVQYPVVAKMQQSDDVIVIPLTVGPTAAVVSR